MCTRHAFVICGLVSVSPLAVMAQQQSAATPELSVTLGIRSFIHSVEGSSPVPVPGAVAPVVFFEDAVNTGTSEVSWIPSIGVTYGSFLASASYLARTDYKETTSAGVPLDFSRKEWDANIGYFFLPALAVTVGYKSLEVEGSAPGVGDGGQKYRGPTLGLISAAPLGDNLSLYGAAAVGRMKIRYTGYLGPEIKSDGLYTFAEIGLRHTFALSGQAGLKAVTASIGYRTQRVRDDGIDLVRLGPNGSMSAYEGHPINRSDGFVIGLFGTF